MIQVFAFEPNLSSTHMLRQSFGMVQRRRAAHKISKQQIELSLERLRVREEQDAMRPYYPSEKCQLFQGMVCGAKRKKRRRVMV